MYEICLCEEKHHLFWIVSFAIGRSVKIMDDVIEIIPLRGIPLIKPGDDIANIVIDASEKSKRVLKEGDVLVIAHTIVSKAENRIVDSKEIVVSARAREIALRNDFEPEQVEVALRESQSVLRAERALITLLSNGHICNFSGVDHSNAPKESYILLPTDPDKSAEVIRQKIEKKLKKRIAIIIADTEGRPWRKGAINIAIGCSGINAFKHNQGKTDLYDRILQRSLVCQIDQIASAAELVMGQANEGFPVVIVRGYNYEEGDERAKDIHRSQEENLFL